MGITRDVVQPVVGFAGVFQSSSTANWFGVAGGTTTTAHNVFTATTYYSVVVDRRELMADFATLDLCLAMQSTAGSTETGNSTPKAITLQTWLQAGASSGGGDMATITPPVTLVDPVYFTTLDTTDMNKASTWLMAGKLGLVSQTSTMMLQPGISAVQTYDLKGVGRFVRQAFAITRTVPTTCTDKLEGAWVSANLIFRDAGTLAVPKFPLFSTSTTTST